MLKQFLKKPVFTIGGKESSQKKSYLLSTPMLALTSLSITFLEDVGTLNGNSSRSLQHFIPMLFGQGKEN